jgi:hypothetical protein
MAGLKGLSARHVWRIEEAGVRVQVLSLASQTLVDERSPATGLTTGNGFAVWVQNTSSPAGRDPCDCIVSLGLKTDTAS